MEQPFFLRGSAAVDGRLGSFLTRSANLSRFPLNSLIFSCIVPPAGFDCSHVSLSRVLDISISFLFGVIQGSCSAEDFLSPLLGFLSAAPASALSGGCAVENSSDIFQGCAGFSCTPDYCLTGGRGPECGDSHWALVFGAASLISSECLGAHIPSPLIKCTSRLPSVNFVVRYDPAVTLMVRKRRAV